MEASEMTPPVPTDGGRNRSYRTSRRAGASGDDVSRWSALAEDHVMQEESYGPQEQQSHNQMLLSLAYGGGNIGAALYDTSTMTVHLMSDTAEQPPFFTQMTRLVEQTQPDQVVTSGRQDERLLRQLKNMLDADVTHDSVSHPRLHLIAAGDYRADNCRHRVMAVRLATDKSVDDTEHQSFVHSHVDFSQTSMIRAFGGLLRFLDRSPQFASMGHQHVRRVRALTLDDVMFVSRATLQNLHVFSNVSHPSSYKADTTKEGLSLFGILNKCASLVGVAQLKKMLLQPLKNRRRLEQRLDSVEFFTQPENQELAECLRMNLRQLRALQPLLNRMHDWHPLCSDWARLNGCLTASAAVVQMCSELPPDVDIFRRVAEAHTPRVHELIHTVQNTVDFGVTRQQGRFNVQLGLDAQLDQWKHVYGDMSDMLEENLRACQPELPEEVDVSSLSFFPLIGFVVLVESWSREMSEEQKMNVSGLEFQFSDEQRFFYKCQHCRKLDAEIGDFSLAIGDRESSIQQQLIRLTLDAEEDIHTMLELCGEIDALLSLARAAIEFNYCRPCFHDEQDKNGGSIQLVDSRHPLLELSATADVVTNSFSSGMPGHCDRVKIVTGANGSGKSVFLKQVALCVFMAQVGSFVAASSVCLSVQNALVTVMPARHTATGLQSGFLHELCQLSTALQLHDSSTTSSASTSQPSTSAERLFVFDELGAGTLAEDGAVLLAAVVTYLTAPPTSLIDSTELVNLNPEESRQREAETRRNPLANTASEWPGRAVTCPHTLVSTHVPRVMSLLPPSQLITPLTSATVSDPQSGEVTHLYQVGPGVAAAGSATLAAAAGANVPATVLNRAQQVLEGLSAGDEPSVETTLREMMSREMDVKCGVVEAFLGCDLQHQPVHEILRCVALANTNIVAGTPQRQEGRERQDKTTTNSAGQIAI